MHLEVEWFLVSNLHEVASHQIYVGSWKNPPRVVILTGSLRDFSMYYIFSTELGTPTESTKV